MKKIYLLWVISIFAISTFSCKDDDDNKVVPPPVEKGAVVINAVIGLEGRANPEDAQGTKWAAGDQICVLTNDSSFLYRYTNNTWAATDTSMYLVWGEESLELSGYYPGTSGVSMKTFSLPVDQKEQKNLAAADYMICDPFMLSECPADKTATLHFSRLTTKVTFRIPAYEGVITDVKITSPCKGITNGTPVEEAVTILPYQTGENQSATYSALLITGEKEVSTENFITFMADDKEMMLQGIPAMTAGYAYQYTLSIEGESVIVTRVEIGEWGDSGKDEPLPVDTILTIEGQALATYSEVTAPYIKELIVTGEMSPEAWTALLKFPRISSITIQDYTGTLPENCFYNLDTKKTTLPTSLKTFKALKVTAIRESAFRACQSLQTIEFPEARIVGDHTFYNCYNLSTISCEKVEKLEAYAFANCKAVVSINFPVLQEAGKSSLYTCSALQNVSLPQVKKLDYGTFYYCKALTSITLPEVTEFDDYTFAHCTALVSAEFPKLKKTGTYTFAQCTAFETLSAPVLKEITDFMFTNTAIKKIPDCLQNVTKVGQKAFYTCKELTEVTLTEIDTVGVGAFYQCAALKQVTLESTRYIDADAFRSCAALERLSLPKVEFIGNFAFNSCTKLESIDLPQALSIGNYTFAKCENIKEVSVPKVEWLGMECFEYCSSLKSFKSTTVKTIDPRCFADCSAMTEVDLPLLTNLSSYMFYRCYALTQVNLPNVKRVGNFVFHTNKALESISLPEVTFFGTNTFNGCANLREVNIPKADTLGFQMFSSCTNLSEISLPRVNYIDSKAFLKCSGLNTVKFGATGEIKFNGAEVFSEASYSTCDLYLNANGIEIQNVTGTSWKDYVWKSVTPYQPEN